MAFLFIITGFASCWLMMHSMCVLFGCYHSSGTLWGCQYKGKGNGQNIIMLIGSLALMVISFVVGLLDIELFADYVFYWMFAVLAGIGLGVYTWILVRNQCYKDNHISAAIADLPFMPDVDRYAAQCHHFELATNGLSFHDEKNNCIGQVFFNDYQLDNIPSNEMFAAYYGFIQKFYGVFRGSAEDRNVGRDKRTDAAIVERHYLFRRKK